MNNLQSSRGQEQFTVPQAKVGNPHNSLECSLGSRVKQPQTKWCSSPSFKSFETILARSELFPSNFTVSQSKPQEYINIGIPKCQTSTKVKFTVSGIQTRITKHAKKQKNRNHDQKKNQSIEADPQMTQMVQLVNKNIKPTIINILHIWKKVEKSMSMLRRDKEDRTKIQIELQN